MHRHLIPVKIRVKCSADKGMELQRLALDENRFKGLDSQPVQGSRKSGSKAVKNNDMATPATMNDGHRTADTR